MTHITLCDNDLVTNDDLTKNKFTKAEDIFKYSLADATQRGLLEINNSVTIMTLKNDIFENLKLLKDYKIIVITTIIPLTKAEKINDYCRKKNKGFVYACQFGFVSFLFEDFGEDFLVIDKNGKKCKNYYIKSITNASPGIVEIDPVEEYDGGKKRKKYLQLETGDYVTFKDVAGMVELNDSPPRPIRVISKSKFTIEETSRYDEFSGLGIVEEVKIPFEVKFLPLSKAKKVLYFENNNENDPNSNNKIIDEKLFDIEYEDMIDDEIKNQNDDNSSWINMFNVANKNESLNNKSNSKLHLSVLTLHDFYLIHKYLPKYNEQQNINDCIEISSRIFAKAKEENEEWAKDISGPDIKYLINIFKFSGLSFPPYIKFFGGIATQEILKYVGLYRPAGQWVYFNLLEMTNCDISLLENEQILKDTNIKLNIEQYMTFDKEKLQLLKNTNFVIVGFNDVGFELLNTFINLNLMANLTIVDKAKSDNYGKITKLKEGKDFKVAIYNNIIESISSQEWWKKSQVILDTFSVKFNRKEKELLLMNCNKYNKILIDVNANKTIASFELILPIELSKKKNISDAQEDMETPNGEEPKIDIINNFQQEKYRNVLSLKESLNLIKNNFESYFFTNIKHLNELIKRAESEPKITKYIDDLMQKENNNEKILKLIRYLKKIVSLKIGYSFESTVLTACELFQEIFQFSIEEILNIYPEDYVELGKHKNFWGGKKYPPKSIIFDADNEEHLQILYLLTQFYCEVLEVKDFDKKANEIKTFAKKYEIKTFDSKIQARAENENYFNIEKNSLVKFVSFYGKSNKFEFKSIKLDIYDNEDINDYKKINKYLKFIILSSNLILKNYGIKPHNNIYQDISLLCKLENILPSTISSICGNLMTQILLMFNDSDILEFLSTEEKKDEIKEENASIKTDNKKESPIFQNAMLNLALNMYLFYSNTKNK